MASNPTTVVYTPASQMRTPGILLRSIWQDIRQSRELSWRLFVRDVSAQYRQSLLGVVWAFVPPIVTSLIFVALRSSSLVSLGETDVPYLYVMVGTILWQLFVESINAPLKAVTAAKPMLAKINFPREALIISALYSSYGLLIKLIVILGVLIVFGIPFTWALPLALGPMLTIVAVGMCLGLLLTPFGMLYTDIASGLPVATQLLFFVTPVVHYVPPDSAIFRLIGALNPVSAPLNAARDLLTKGTMTHPEALAAVAGLSLFGMFVALVIYRAALPIFIERTSA